MGHRGIVATALGLACLAAACTLVTSLDGLSEKEAPTDGRDEDTTTGPEGAALPDGPSEGATALACNAPGLVAYWTFDEGTGTVAHDCSANKLDGTLVGAAFWGMRDGGACVELSGTNAHVSLGSAPSALQIAGAFTIAGWVRPDVKPSTYVGIFWHFSSVGYELTMNKLGELYTQVALDGPYGAVSAFPSRPIQLGIWQHVAAVFEPGVRLELYFDGQSVKKQTTLPDGTPLPQVGSAQYPGEFRIGAITDTDGTTWRAGIDDLRVYSRALSTAEIQALEAQ